MEQIALIMNNTLSRLAAYTFLDAMEILKSLVCDNNNTFLLRYNYTMRFISYDFIQTR